MNRLHMIGEENKAPNTGALVAKTTKANTNTAHHATGAALREAGDNVNKREAAARGKDPSTIKPEVPSIVYDHTFAKSNSHIKLYHPGKLLGIGGFAACYELTSCDSKHTYAAKIVSKKSLRRSQAKLKLQNEITVHRALKHPNIVRFERYFEDDQNVYLLLELCRHQSLHQGMVCDADVVVWCGVRC